MIIIVLRLLLSKIYLISLKQGKCLLFYRQTNVNIAMHSDVYEQICYSFGMIIDTIILYTLILV